MTEDQLTEIKEAVRFFYDLQQMRISAGLRGRTGKDITALSERHLKSLHVQSFLLETLEKKANDDIKELIKGVPIYEKWLKLQKGCGHTLSGVILSEIRDIKRFPTVSHLWSYSGLATRPQCLDCKHNLPKPEGNPDEPGPAPRVSECPKCGSQNLYWAAQRRHKGEKANYNPWLKAKLVKVLGDCLIKANSPTWREFYDNYKHRKKNTQVSTCMGCAGTKKRKDPKTEKIGPCSNCNGTGGPAPWGKSDAHRHQAAVRYMVKMFVLGMFNAWRELEGLPKTPTYQETYLAAHGQHGLRAV